MSCIDSVVGVKPIAEEDAVTYPRGIMSLVFVICVDSTRKRSMKSMGNLFCTKLCDFDLRHQGRKNIGLLANVEVTGAARLYRAASVWTAGLARRSFCERLANGGFVGQRADLPANK